MKVIGALMDLFKMVDKGTFSGRVSFGSARIKSISSFSSKGTYYFPMILSDQVSLDETKMITKAVEKTYATFVATCISLIPFHRIRACDRGSVDSYLKIFHQNIGISEPSDIGVTVENASMVDTAIMAKAQEEWKRVLKESSKYYFEDIAEVPVVKAISEMYVSQLPGKMSYQLRLNEDVVTDLGDGNDNDVTGNTGEVNRIQVFDRSVFQDQEMKKANEMLPTLVKANIGFVIEGTEEVIQREIIVGVKTFVRRIKSAFLVNELYDTIMTKRKFLRFVKIMTGEEEETLMDLILGLKEIKSDATKKMNGSSNDILLTGKGRRRMANLTSGVLRNNYNPNLTLVMTMNEVNMLKDKGIDLFSSAHVELLIKELFFLGFVILDQANEIAYIQFDSHNYSFQEYPYSTLEREVAQNDRMMRELYRTMQR